MLKNLVKDLFKRIGAKSVHAKKAELIEKISDAVKSRETQHAIKLLRLLLELDPKNIQAMTELGIRLAEVGEANEAFQFFELAHRLDDSNMLVAVNYASHLLAKHQKTSDVIELLERAQLFVPNYPQINTAYAAVQLSLGNAENARKFSLKGWLADFDNNRMADSYLWYASYADIPENTLAAEHHFWSNTCNPFAYPSASIVAVPENAPHSRRLRIGYWSPDFRDHSVRYFFRPLLEGHDRSKVELILYHDTHGSDAQTAEIKNHCDRFYSVHEKTDQELAKFIVSHNLDVLVELAGHTSHNRLWMLQARLAKLQITALGYPATTGLRGIDAKIVDVNLFSEGDEKYYSEIPMVLPQSFWCFDPHEETSLAAKPPVKVNGHITFGCIGNIAKINPRILNLWAEIMRRVPRSQLVIRSVNFIDKLSIESFKNKIISIGIDAKRVQLLGPAVGKDFFRTYDEIDIVLDTFPFNGGTTSCFAVYMGVPVITLSGRSLISRMGASVMANVGGAKWVAQNEDEYVSKAIKLSQDINELQDFRDNARARMQKTSLGNGRKYASEFEDACVTWLMNADERQNVLRASMPILDPHEIVRRAAVALGNGQTKAAARIVDYCLKYYPNFAGAHILITDGFTQTGDFTKAASYLLERLSRFDEEGKTAALINIVRFLIFAGDRVGVTSNIDVLKGVLVSDAFEKAQADLYFVLLDWYSAKKIRAPKNNRWKKIHCVIPCDDSYFYNEMVKAIKNCCNCEADASIIFERCSETLKIDSYEKALQLEGADVVVLLQKNIAILNPDFFHEIAEALVSSDVVGYSGISEWNRLDWRQEPSEKRRSGVVANSMEKPGYFEVLIAGLGREKISHDMTVLEGGVLAMNAHKAQHIVFDPEFTNAESLLEEYWTYTAAKAGLKLTTNRALGVQVRSDVSLNQTSLIAARKLLVERMNFEVFSTERNDGAFLVCPCVEAKDGVEILALYFS
jgi:protein O-GlcNAc transferase